MKTNSSSAVSAEVRLFQQNLQDKNHIGSLSKTASFSTFSTELRRPQSFFMQPQEVGGGYIRAEVTRLAQEGGTPPRLVGHANNSMNYLDQIRCWYLQLSKVQRARLYTIDEIIRLARLEGRLGRKASVQLVGNALTACGFMPKRDWTAAGRNKRYWKFFGDEK